MRTFETKIQELKTAVLTEVARLTWEDRLQTGTAILDIPEKFIPGPTATLRCCIYKERAIINQAKALLMERNNMSEEEAHRYIQKCSMDSGTNMLETAQMVISLM